MCLQDTGLNSDLFYIYMVALKMPNVHCFRSLLTEIRYGESSKDCSSRFTVFSGIDSLG